jgi:hypothetical protein
MRHDAFLAAASAGVIVSRAAGSCGGAKANKLRLW